MVFSRETPSGLVDFGRIFPKFLFSLEDLIPDTLNPAPPVIFNYLSFNVMISYEVEKNLSLADFIYLLNDSGLGKRRPMHDQELLNRMLVNSNLVIVAREGLEVLGVLRALTDFSYRTFIADLAVVSKRQGEGIGRGMLQFARTLAPDARLILFSAENALGFYQKLGFHLHERCYQLKVGEKLC